MIAPRRWRFANRAQGLVTLTAVATLAPIWPAAAQARPRLWPQVAYQRLDSLEAAALTGATFADRLDAVTTITHIAGPQLGRQGQCVEAPAPSVIDYPGLVSRLAAIYRRSQDADLRRAIVDNMLWQVECSEAAAFLAGVAEEAPAERDPPFWVVDELRGSLQWEAISVLGRLGPSGESTLRRLYAEGTVRDPSAKASLEALAQHGFRWP